MVVVLKVMADATRLRILGALAERPHTGKELSERLSLTPPTISHHMRKLEDASLVQSVGEAQRHWYHLDTDSLRETSSGVRATSLEVPSRAEAPVDEEGRFRAKVLRDFFDGERLRQIPAQRKKRVVVLQHLLLRFETDRQYPEREVNDLLRLAHDDVATLRRELVDYGYMQRERGLYRVAREPPGRSVQVAQEIVGDERDWLRRLVASATERALHTPVSITEEREPSSALPR